MTAGYSAPAAWASGPDLVYEPLSRAVVADHAASLSGRRVLDVGAGTGATSRALQAVGARPIALDASWPMLEFEHRSRPPAVVSDACATGIAGGAFDATMAAFVLSHVDDPVALLREAGRVTAGGGTVLAVTFAQVGPRAAANGVVDALLYARGWVLPEWYRRLKDELEPAVAEPDRLLSMACAAGLSSPEVTSRVVDTGIDHPEVLVGWRLGSPAAAAFVSAMPEDDRRALKAEAVAAVGPVAQPLVFELRVLSSLAPANLRTASA